MTEDEILKAVKETVADYIKTDDVDPNSKLSDLGLDSLDKAEIVINLEDKLDIHFEDEEMASIEKVQDLLDLIAKKKGL